MLIRSKQNNLFFLKKLWFYIVIFLFLILLCFFITSCSSTPTYSNLTFDDTNSYNYTADDGTVYYHIIFSFSLYNANYLNLTSVTFYLTDNGTIVNSCYFANFTLAPDNYITCNGYFDGPTFSSTNLDTYLANFVYDSFNNTYHSWITSGLCIAFLVPLIYLVIIWLMHLDLEWLFSKVGKFVIVGIILGCIIIGIIVSISNAAGAVSTWILMFSFILCLLFCILLHVLKEYFFGPSNQVYKTDEKGNTYIKTKHFKWEKVKQNKPLKTKKSSKDNDSVNKFTDFNENSFEDGVNAFNESINKFVNKFNSNSFDNLFNKFTDDFITDDEDYLALKNEINQKIKKLNWLKDQVNKIDKNYKMQINQLQNLIKQNQAELKKLEKQNDNDEYEDEINQINDEIEELETKIEDLNDELESKTEDKNEEINDLEEEIEDLKSDLNDLKEELIEQQKEENQDDEYDEKPKTFFNYNQEKNNIVNNKSKKINIKDNKNKAHPNFSDIAGCELAKKSFYEKVIYPIEHKELYEKFNKKYGGGILLYGPPGTGKTLFAQAAANEINFAFFSIKSSDIKSKWIGESEQNIKALFAAAKKAKNAIIFIDEFDALGKSRDSGIGGDPDVDIVPEILAQMQGFEKQNSNLIVIAATNCPWKIDSALLRPGRFDEKIYLGLPDFAARKMMFNLMLKDAPIEKDIDIDELATFTENCNGADINYFCEQLKQSVINRAIKQNNTDPKNLIITKDDVLYVKRHFKSSVSFKDLERLSNWEDEIG